MTVMFRAAKLTDFPQFTSRSGFSGFGRASKQQALAHSAFWACIRLRADLISTLPVDVYRRVGGVQVEVQKPPVLVNPSGDTIDITEWLYSTQSDLDACGNTFGLITARDGLGLPSRIDLVPREEVTVEVRGAEVKYRFGSEKYDAGQVWHEKQYTESGMVVGLSPLAKAAMSLYQFRSAQEFAVQWFAGGAIPTGILKYEKEKLEPKETDGAKARYKLAVENRDVFVVGRDWDYKVIESQASQASFIETMRVTDIDICRFLGVPGDMVDAHVQGSSITYANITQRNLQLLIMNLGPAIIRREKALGRLLPNPRFVKLNTEALLRMDPETVSTMLGQEVKDRLRTATEAREKLNLPPYTPEQIAEFQVLFPTRTNEPSKGLTA